MIFPSGDTEVLLRSYEQWGSNCVDYLQGMFAFAIWDSNEKMLLLFRDRLGIKPLYYTISGTGIAFASEARALAVLVKSLIPPVISKDAIAYLLFYGYIPSPHAIWDRMFKLEPGHVLSISANGNLNLKKYWEPPDSIDSYWANNRDFNSTFEDVVNSHLISDVPQTLFLSGGNDSLAVATAISKNSSNFNRNKKISAFTLGFDGVDDEVAVAKEAARVLGLDHLHKSMSIRGIDCTLSKVLEDYDEPMTLSATMSMHQLCEMVSLKYSVALSGDGADEVFGGYNWYRNIKIRNDAFFLKSFRKFFSQKINDPLSYHLVGNIHRRISVIHEHSWRVFPRFFPEEIEEILSPINVSFNDEKALYPMLKHDKPKLPLLRRLQRIDLMTFCTDHCCAKVDRSAMAYGLEVRVPFLDHRMVELGITKPVSGDECKVGKSLIKNYLKFHLRQKL